MTPGIVAFFTIIAVLLAFYAAFAPRRRVVTPLGAENPDDTTTTEPTGLFDKYVRPAVWNFLPTAPPSLAKYAYTSPGIASLLRRSGNPWKVTPEEFLIVRLLSAAAISTVGSALTAFGLVPLNPVLGFLLGAAIGYLLPQSLLAGEWSKRRRDLSRTLPEALDLLRICLNAGYNFTNALSQVIHLIPEGPTRSELSRVVADLQTGRTITQAMDDFANRAPLDQVEAFVSAVGIAQSMGTDMGSTLAGQANEARAQYERKIEQRAQKLQTTLFLPIIGMFLPALVILIFAPSVSDLGSIL